MKTTSTIFFFTFWFLVRIQLASTVTAHEDKGHCPEKASYGRPTIASTLVRRASSGSGRDLSQLRAQSDDDKWLDLRYGSGSKSRDGDHDHLRRPLSHGTSSSSLPAKPHRVSRSYARMAFRSKVDPTLQVTGITYDMHADNTT